MSYNCTCILQHSIVYTVLLVDDINEYYKWYRNFGCELAPLGLKCVNRLVKPLCVLVTGTAGTAELVKLVLNTS